MGNVKSFEGAETQQNVSQVSRPTCNPHKGKVRVVHLLKHPVNGYGFYLIQKVHLPGAYVSRIDAGGAADIAGLYNNDRIVAINGICVVNASHEYVLSLIMAKESQVVFTVMDEEAMKRFQDNTFFPTRADIVLAQESTLRNIQLHLLNNEGYGVSVRTIEGPPSIHFLYDVKVGGSAWNAGLRDGEVLLAINGEGVLRDDQSTCFHKLCWSGDPVLLTVGGIETCQLVTTFNVRITIDLIAEWPTREQLQVPPLRGTTRMNTGVALTHQYARGRYSEQMPNRSNVYCPRPSERGMGNSRSRPTPSAPVVHYEEHIHYHVATPPGMQRHETERWETTKAENNSVTCAICYENVRDTMFQPCSHVCCCRDCAFKVNNCPVCRKDITNRLRAIVS